MNAQEVNAAKMLLMVNSMRLITEGLPPAGPRLQVTKMDMMAAMMAARSPTGVSTEAKCVGEILAYYTHGEKADSSAKSDYPTIYESVEKRILGCEHLRDYLSALADGMYVEGDDIPMRRLKAVDAYVETSYGKREVMAEFGVTENAVKIAETRASQSGCLVPIVLILGVMLTAYGMTSGNDCKQQKEQDAYEKVEQVENVVKDDQAVLTAERYGERRNLNAPVAIDKDGDIHYRTEYKVQAGGRYE